MLTQQGTANATTPPKKASIGQVVATMFWGLFMIGKKGTWEREGAVVTLPQMVVGAVVAGVLVVSLLLLIVSLVVPH
jgi:hypothetical protein